MEATNKAAHDDSAYDPNKSDPIPAMSPTTKRPLAARRNPITAPDRKAVMNALPTLFLASNVVLAFAYVAIFIPRNPERTDVRAPSKKATVVKKALANAGLALCAKVLDRSQKQKDDCSKYCCKDRKVFVLRIKK
ncbi:hypothetical protein Ccrd_010584 [Cynara cardunculus var. scolymus]|uniref:Uncharacterized protein n=1 Tax=Cynara cardunculus var. scolymus TaxID=59895 RepID=A0A118K6Q3_CYNCS|nr:hypothetical protein Ccrd_010584 [Cynara cardunculus var. scolymus]